MKLSLVTSLIALLGFLTINLSPVQAAAAPAATAPAKERPIPFHGKLKSVDAAAQTITIEGKKADRVFSLTSETKITDGSGAASTLAAATPGEDVGGSYTKDAAGTMTLHSVRFGAKAGGKEATKTPSTAAASAPAPAAAPTATAPPVAAPPVPAATKAPAPAAAEAKAKKQSASGKVVSVDGTANTITVHGKTDQTFTVAPEAKITGAASLAAITAGSHVKIGYTKSADGATLTASSVAVGK